MVTLVIGLVLLLGSHSVRVFADDWRAATVARIGENRWKLAYSAVALIGVVLVVYGYAEARTATSLAYPPPSWGRHAAALLVLVAFVLIVAAYVPGTAIKARVGHPMVLGVVAWALGHLLANGTVADLVLFGAFFVWGVVDYIAARRRDRAAAVVYPASGWSRDALAVVVGVVAYLVFAFWLHGPLIGVRPFA